MDTPMIEWYWKQYTTAKGQENQIFYEIHGSGTPGDKERPPEIPAA